MDLGADINGRRVCCLLYADDIVIFCNTESDLQKLLDRAHRWCYKWKMQINHEKSNIVHFRRKRVNRSSRRFKFGSKEPSVVNSYKYLGFSLDEHLDFVQGVDVLSSSAGRALSSVIAKFKDLRNVGFTTYTKLYNCCVKPILEYSSAVWKDKKYIEHIKVFNHVNRAIRYFLGLPRTAPIVGMCGDMGWIAPAYSLSLNRLRLWNKLCAMHPDRLTKRIFEWDWLKKNNNWSEDILHLLNKLDMADLFYNQNYCDLKETETKLYELCAIQWKESLMSFPKLRTYIKHKVEYKEECYLMCNLSKSKRSLLAQLRLGVLPLAIETGRYTGKSIELRVCVVCDSIEIENELHFICQCSRYDELRK